MGSSTIEACFMSRHGFLVIPSGPVCKARVCGVEHNSFQRGFWDRYLRVQHVRIRCLEWTARGIQALFGARSCRLCGAGGSYHNGVDTPCFVQLLVCIQRNCNAGTARVIGNPRLEIGMSVSATLPGMRMDMVMCQDEGRAILVYLINR